MTQDVEPQARSARSDGPPARGERVRVHLALGDVSVSFTGRRAFFEAHVLRLMEAMYARASAGGAAAGPEGPTFQPASPQQFQQYAAQVGANAATIEQRAMAFAFYLWNYERQDAFDAEDIAAFFRTVHEEPPDDLAELLERLASTRRWLESGRSAGWQLTTKGVNYVKNRLLGDA